MTTNITEQFSRFAADLTVGNVGASVIAEIRKHVADTYVAGIAGACMPMNAVYLAGVAASTPPGDVLVPETAICTDAHNAAACLAGLAHSTEADDGYRAGSYHPGVVCVPTGLYLGHAQGQALSDILTAVIAGYEISCRISELMHPMSRKRGFHNTGIIGVLGAAVTAGQLFGLDGMQMRHGIGLAASAAGGLFAFVDGGDTKRLHPAHAVKVGIEAAIFAREGVEGPPDVLQSPNGFLSAYAGDEALMRAELMQLSWDSLVADKCYIKPYACCRHLHPGMEAAMTLADTHSFSADDIQSIEIRTYAIAAAHAEVGWETSASAQLSYPYCIAAALVHGPMTPQHVSEDYLRDPEVNRLAAHIQVKTDETSDRRYPAERPASVKLMTKAGTGYETSVSIPLGAPERPLDDAAFRLKLAHMLEPARDGALAKTLVKAIL
ncbi:MAG: MmgE/PrpD family protein, partial [Methyloligellaceae bacterium]